MQEFALIGSFASPMKLLRRSGNGDDWSFVHDIDHSGPSPTYIVQSNNKKFIYCCCEAVDPADSYVLSFEVDTESPTSCMSFLNKVPSEGGAPTHLCVDPLDKYLFVSNYFGNLTVLPIDCDGVLLPATQVINLTDGMLRDACGLNRGGSHVHQSVCLAASSTLLVCDLGLNCVVNYKVNSSPQAGADVLVEDSRFHLPEGSGPRHLVVDPIDSAWVCVVNELSNTVVLSTIDPSTQRLQPLPTDCDRIQCSTTNHTPFTHLENTSDTHVNSAEILCSPCGKYLFVSVRDVRDSAVQMLDAQPQCRVCVFEVCKEGVHFFLQPKQDIYTEGRHPRALTLSSDGQSLWVVNKDGLHTHTHTHQQHDEGDCNSAASGDPISTGVNSGNLVQFAVDVDTGHLTLVGACTTLGCQLPQPSWMHILT